MKQVVIIEARDLEDALAIISLAVQEQGFGPDAGTKYTWDSKTPLEFTYEIPANAISAQDFMKDLQDALEDLDIIIKDSWIVTLS